MVLAGFHVLLILPVMCAGQILIDVFMLLEADRAQNVPVFLQALLNGALLVFTIKTGIAYFWTKRAAVRLMMLLYALLIVASILDLGLMVWMQQRAGYTPNVAELAMMRLWPNLFYVSALAYFALSKAVRRTFVAP